jgi:hypothetical protein
MKNVKLSIIHLNIKILCLIFLCLFKMLAFATDTIIINKENEKIQLHTINRNTDFATNNLEYKYVIKNLVDENNFYISIVNPIIDSIKIEYQNNVAYFGDKVDASSNKIKNINYVLPIKIQKDSTINISITLISQKEQLSVSIFLEAENLFLKIINRDSIFLGFFIGVYFLYILLLISMYAFSKNIFFRKYMYMNIIIICIYIYFSGFGSQYIWNNSKIFQIILPSILFLIYAFQHVSFIYHFFNIGKEYKKLSIIIFIYLVIVFIFSISQMLKLTLINSLIIEYKAFTIIVYSIFMFYIAVSLFVSIKTYRKTKRNEALWVFSGLMIQTFSWIIFINTLYNTFPVLNKISNIDLFESNIFISHFNFILIFTEIVLITTFITFNYRNIIKQNSISYSRLQFLQSRNLKEYQKGIANTRKGINIFLEKNILKEVLEIKNAFKDFIFFKEINKLNSNIIKNIEQAEQELHRIMNDADILDINTKNYGNIVQEIFSKLPSDIKYHLQIDIKIRDKIYNEKFNNHIYRIIQELLNNILKHSKSTQIYFDTNIIEQEFIYINLYDDSTFNLHAELKKGLGIINIENRLKEIDGELHIDNKHNYWKTSIKIPIQQIE